MPIENSEDSQIFRDAYNSLQSLGFNSNEINKCLSMLTNKTDSNFNTQDLIREALKALKSK